MSFKVSKLKKTAKIHAKIQSDVLPILGYRQKRLEFFWVSAKTVRITSVLFFSLFDKKTNKTIEASNQSESNSFIFETRQKLIENKTSVIVLRSILCARSQPYLTQKRVIG